MNLDNLIIGKEVNNVEKSLNDFSILVIPNGYRLTIIYKYPSFQNASIEFNRRYIELNIDAINQKYSINLNIELFI